MPKMTFDDWVRSKKSAISKVASQRHETYEEVLAAMDYAWYNGQENVGQHFRTQCPHFGDMEKDDPIIRSVSILPRQTKQGKFARLGRH